MAIGARERDLLDQSAFLFGKKGSLHLFWQEIAENFYPERATFTATPYVGRNMADNLTTSYPILCRRDLGNIFSAMLRPSDQQWGHVSTMRPDREDNEAKQWLERATQTQWRAMYDIESNFMRATTEADHDFAAFGQCVPSCVLNRYGNGLSFRCWHLRDMAWAENHEGHIDDIRRKWKATIRDLYRMFERKNGIAPELMKHKDKEPFREVQCCHMVIPIDQYSPPAGQRKPSTPYVSIFIDEENGFIMQEEGVYNKIYAPARWQTVSDSQYAYSPSTIAALPDARLIQAQTLVLLEAGEKAVTPPMVTPGDVIRSDIALYAGGVTTYDAEYDEKSGQILRPIPVETAGLGFGMALRTDVKEMISQAFFLNKIGLPPIGRDMTAFEVGQRVSEYVRNALPLFSPMESEYNGQLCMLVFDIMMRAGAFGPPQEIPDSIRGADIMFKFESPLRAAIDSQKGQKFMSAKAMLAEAAAIDPGAPTMIDARAALRDALEGVGTPQSWMRSDKDMEDIAAKEKQAVDTQQMLASLGQGADVANKLGQAGQSLGIIPPAGNATRAGTPSPLGI